MLLIEWRWTLSYRIKGQKNFSLQPVVRTRLYYKRVKHLKRQKSFKGIAMYGREVLMSLQEHAKFFVTHFLHSYVSEIGLSGE